MISKEKKEYLIQCIKDIILDLYNSFYNRPMDIIQTDDGYILKMYLTHDFITPLHIYIQCNSEEEFLSKIKDELQLRQLNLTKYYTGCKLNIDEYRSKKRISRISDSKS